MGSALNDERLLVKREPAQSSSREVMRKGLLVCGVAASVLYVAANVIAPMSWAEYSVVDQTVSELSAIGAPTRRLWVALMIPYGVLLAVFGWGVWISGVRNKDEGGSRNALRIVGAALIAQGVLGFFWPPMHLRGAETSMTDTLHIIFTLVVVPLMMLGIWFSSAVVGKRYALATLAVVILFGALAGFYGPNIAADLPTPRAGVWERISIGAWTVWVIVLAVILLKVEGSTRFSNADSGD